MSTSTWRVPGYVVEEPLGFGSTGEVWRARVASTGERVALKRIRVGDPERARAARTEAAMLGALDHANLVRLHELVPVGDSVVLVLDLAAGGSLAQLVAARARLTPGEVISALSAIGAALAYAHTAGVVHGDVTPANVLFTDFGLPLLADLGVARIVGDDSLVHSTPAFIDPSVAAGCVPTPASDVFMLGGVALFALTGEPLWPGDSPAEVCGNAIAGASGDVGARLAAANVPAEIAEVVGRALCPEPHRRCTAAEFALDLRHAGTPVAVELAAGLQRAQPVRPDPSAGGAVLAAARAGGRHAADPGRRGSRPEPAPAGRPAFDRPHIAVAPSAPPLTHGVRVRPLAARPTRRPWHRRRGVRPALAAAATGLVALTTAFVLRPGGHPARTQPAAARPSPTVAAAPAQLDAPGAQAVLDRLDALRAEAFAQRAPALLARVYQSSALADQDAALLAKLVPSGCGLTGVRTSYRNVALVARTATTVGLRVDATLAPSALVCHGTAQGRAVGTGPVRLRIDLVRSSAGFLIAAESRS